MALQIMGRDHLGQPRQGSHGRRNPEEEGWPGGPRRQKAKQQLAVWLMTRRPGGIRHLQYQHLLHKHRQQGVP